MQHSPALQRLVPVPAVTEEIGEAQGGLLGFHRLFLNFGMWIPKADNKT